MPSPLAPSSVPGVTTPSKDKPNAVIGGATGILGQNVVTNGATGILGVGDFLGKVSNVNLWKRIGIVAIGVLMVWWAVLIFISTNKKIQGAVAGTAKKVISATPQGAAANIATGSIGL